MKLLRIKEEIALKKYDLMRIHKIFCVIWTTIMGKPCCFPFEVKDVPLFLRGKLLA